MRSKFQRILRAQSTFSAGTEIVVVKNRGLLLLKNVDCFDYKKYAIGNVIENGACAVEGKQVLTTVAGWRYHRASIAC